ncbi:unnamed protein product [Bemisia tabaci]|uniref:LIM zinc-binding domain-containing protein n=1 Tax=Bemisia tabaci TaxID=7038 RepID=A0A9P0AF13_BEMTA|nr:unnamed protein product [Bemisia tabaci]
MGSNGGSIDTSQSTPATGVLTVRTVSRELGVYIQSIFNFLSARASFGDGGAGSGAPGHVTPEDNRRPASSAIVRRPGSAPLSTNERARVPLLSLLHAPRHGAAAAPDRSRHPDFLFRTTQILVQPDRHQMLATAYDPSRDLSPNLPTLSGSGRGSEPMTTFGANGPCAGGGGGGGGYCPLKREYEAPEEDCRGCRDANANCDASADSGEYCMKSCSEDYLVEPKPEPQGQRVEAAPADGNAAEDECAGCGRRIRDRFLLLACDRRWHQACLQCCQCRATLESDVTCFTKDGNIYCRKDYYSDRGILLAEAGGCNGHMS